MTKTIPKLRFPEFSDDLIEKEVGDFAPLQRGFDLPVSQTVEGKYPVVFSNGILKFHNQYKVNAPGVVTGRSGTIGRVTYVEDDYWPHNTALWVTDFCNNFPKFVYYFFEQLRLERFAAGSGVPTLNRNDVHQQIVYVPSQEEQQKIASFLSTVDKKIAQLTKRKKVLVKYKKGVMQQIFDQRIRFKDDNGNDFSEWVEGQISSVCEILYGRDQKEVIDESGIYPILGTGGEIGRTNEFLYDKPSVLIGRKGTIDKPQFMDTPFWTVDTLFYTRVYESVVPRWLFYQFQMINWYRYNEASGVPSLSATTVSKIRIRIPEKSEQEHIASFLSAIDKKIFVIDLQLQRTRKFKNGLLQQLFV